MQNTYNGYDTIQHLGRRRSLSVEEYWDGYRELRQSFIKQHTGNVYDIFNEYPVLKQEFGYMLVHITKDS